jgi:hypothetical protein
VHLELVDVLRCVQPHEASPLIATIDRAHGRVIDRGLLACPICDARYPIDAGAVTFDDGERTRRRAHPAGSAATPDAILRAAALLGLSEPGGLLLLGGMYAAVAAALRDRADVSIVLLNPPGVVAAWEGVTPIYSSRVPLGPAVLRGAAIDQDTMSDIEGLVTALRASGRLVSPASTPLPAGVRELARDDVEWVAERVVEPLVVAVPLRRGPAHSAG